MKLFIVLAITNLFLSSVYAADKIVIKTIAESAEICEAAAEMINNSLHTGGPSTAVIVAQCTELSTLSIFIVGLEQGKKSTL